MTRLPNPSKGQTMAKDKKGTAPKRRNLVAAGLSQGQFQPRVHENKGSHKAYRRKDKHPPDLHGENA